MINKLQYGQMIGIFDKKNKQFEAAIVPKDAENLNIDKIDKKLFIKYKIKVTDADLFDSRSNSGVENEVSGQEFKEERRQFLRKLTFDNYKVSTDFIIWTIVKEFKYYVCGDLAFYATIQWRDGSSHCRCPWCDSLIHNLKEK